MYIKTTDNKTELSECRTIELNGRMISNPTQEDISKAGWLPYVPEKPALDEIKKHKIREIEHYDNSKEVNEFFINGNSIWLDRNTRASLNFRLSAEEASGKENTTLWDGNGHSYNIPISVAKQLLVALELYASQAYDVTAQHIANVLSLETEKEVKDYNHKSGYPNKLRFLD